MALTPRYLLQAGLDYDNGRVTTTETVNVTNASDSSIDHLHFSVLARHWGRLTVSWISVDGRRVTPSFPNSADMRVSLNRNLPPGESAQIVLRFTAVATSDVTDSLEDRLSKANGLMQVSAWYPVLSDGHGARRPGDSQYTVVADYRLELSHPAGVVIAAPGSLVSSSPRTKVYTRANAREFAFAASPDFKISEVTTAEGVSVVVYYLPGTRGADKAARVAASALEMFSSELGAYPYQRFVVAPDTRPHTGAEYSGIVFIGSAFLRSAEVVAHEVAHQWWYGIVGDDQLREPWLDESFAEFTGHWFTGTPVPQYCSTRKVTSSVYDFPDLPAPTTLHDCDSYDQTIYYKGAAFLDGMRVKMGHRAFFAALRALVAENRFGVITTDIVRATFLRFATERLGLNAYMDLYLR